MLISLQRYIYFFIVIILSVLCIYCDINNNNNNTCSFSIIFCVIDKVKKYFVMICVDKYKILDIVNRFFFLNTW